MNRKRSSEGSKRFPETSVSASKKFSRYKDEPVKSLKAFQAESDMVKRIAKIFFDLSDKDLLQDLYFKQALDAVNRLHYR